jgi:hypothetical protein
MASASRVVVVAVLAGLVGCAETSGAKKPGAGAPVTFGGGDGLSCDKRVLVHAENEAAGADAEEHWLLAHYPGHQRGLQKLGRCGETPVEIIRIQTERGESYDFYFDISEFAGHF